MDRYRIVHKIRGKGPEEDGAFSSNFKATVYMWRGEDFPTRSERAAAFLCSIDIMKGSIPLPDGDYTVTHQGPILQERYVKKSRNKWGRKITALAWRETPDELAEPGIVGDPNNS